MANNRILSLEELNNLSFGQRVHYYRTRAGLTMEDVAERMQYKSRATINSIEKDKSNMPFHKVVMLANVLGVSVDELSGVQQNLEDSYQLKTMDLTFLDNNKNKQYELWELLNYIVEMYRQGNENDLLFEDLSNYSDKEKKLIRNIIPTIVEGLKE